MFYENTHRSFYYSIQLNIGFDFVTFSAALIFKMTKENMLFFQIFYLNSLNWEILLRLTE